MSARDQFDFGAAFGGKVHTALLLSNAEIEALTGYKKPALQVQELKARGFYRARRNVLNHVVLERAHFESVCAGIAASGGPASERPRVMTPFPVRGR